MIQLAQQRGGLVGGGVAHQLHIKVIIKGDMGHRAALDGLHIVAAGTDDLDDLGQLAGLVVHGEQQGEPVARCGLGRPSQACEAMEMGAAAIMANTAIATSGDVALMASAFRDAIIAGRNAYLAGLGRTLDRGASASSPLTGFLHE